MLPVPRYTPALGQPATVWRMTARIELPGPDGAPCATYVRGTRDGLPIADLLWPCDGAVLRVVVAAAIAELPGWLVAVSPGPLSDALLRAGGIQRRHAHVMQLDLGGTAPRPAAPLAPGVSVARLDRQALPAGLGDVSLAAYPSNHPDACPGETAVSALAELQRIADGHVTGPLHAASRVALGGDGRPLGAVFVNDRSGTGPWITELFRCPSPDGRGLGGALLDHAVTAVRASGGMTVGLAVTDGNPAQAVYAGRGFAVHESAITLLLPG